MTFKDINCEKYYGVPCSYVAVEECCGKRVCRAEFPTGENGYMTLKKMNKLVRSMCKVKKRTEYRRGERPILKNFSLDGKAIICVLGHYVYAENNQYHSCFEVDNAEVVAVWEIA